MYKVKVLTLDVDACDDFSLGCSLQVGKRRIYVGKEKEEDWSWEDICKNLVVNLENKKTPRTTKIHKEPLETWSRRC